MIELYKPEINDLWFKQKMLSDEQTMSYNNAYGGTIHFPEECWETWYNKWIVNHEQKRFYRYIMVNNTFVGEVSYHWDEIKHIYMVDVLIYNQCRHKGYGREALIEICHIAKTNGIHELFDEIAADNTSINMFLKNGFEEVTREEEFIQIKIKL